MSADAYTLDWSMIESGGGEISNGTYQLQVTLAQTDVGVISGGIVTLEGR